MAKIVENAASSDVIESLRIQPICPLIQMELKNPERPPKDAGWEKKQRDREYRVAARREKRNRKADEKKQRKLNATILRRMTRNPDKYNKNTERNRLRAIEMERRKIWREAINQARRLAAIHDTSGAMFNVGPVITTSTGTVVSEEAFRRKENQSRDESTGERPNPISMDLKEVDNEPSPSNLRMPEAGDARTNFRSRTQAKKLARFQPISTPPKPTRPDHISIVEGEEDWLSLWDLDDMELERRVNRTKRANAAARKALRTKQQSGKAERRMARDEKRRVYRDYKQEWKVLRDEQTRERKAIKALEGEEAKRIAVYVCETERSRAMTYCQNLGFTLQNTDGVNDIKPKALGMKGVTVDFEALQMSGTGNGISAANARTSSGLDPSALGSEEELLLPRADLPLVQEDDFIKIDVGAQQHFEPLSFNHKVRRKLRRAIEHAEIEKELLVRNRALSYLQSEGKAPPAVLQTTTKAKGGKGARMLENGTLETEKQERIRGRMDLAAFNSRMRVLRKQAKDAALYAGLLKHAEVTGRLQENPPSMANKQAAADLATDLMIST